MRYLKLYENFELSEEVWVIMDDDEELVFGDMLKMIDEDNDGFWTSIMIPTENANKDTFREFSYASEKLAMDKIGIINKRSDIRIGYDHTPKFMSNWKSPLSVSKKIGGTNPTRLNPYKRFFNGDDLVLKPVKFFMGIMKADELNI